MSAPLSLLPLWLFDGTLPYWRRHAVDDAHGGFHEDLDVSLRARSETGKRTMVQARQIFTFCEAYRRSGDCADLDAALSGFGFLQRFSRHPEGGWRHKTAADGAPLDDRRTLYDQAFILFAMAEIMRSAGDRAGQAIDIATGTFDFIDREMCHPKGGYLDSVPRSDASDEPRMQNPHMHLLEAFLALFDSTGDDRWLDHAARMAALFKQHFFVDGSLREYFTDSWMPAPGIAGAITEPGHQFEWCWLLHKYAAATGDRSVIEAAAAIYRFSCAHGIDEASGGVLDEVLADGTPYKSTRRLWPQSEAMKAHWAQQRHGDPDAAARLDAAAEALWRNHLSGQPDGGWREQIDADGALIRDDKPASSLYHLAMAAHETVPPSDC